MWRDIALSLATSSNGQITAVGLLSLAWDKVPEISLFHCGGGAGTGEQPEKHGEVDQWGMSLGVAGSGEGVWAEASCFLFSPILTLCCMNKSLAGKHVDIQPLCSCSIYLPKWPWGAHIGSLVCPWKDGQWRGSHRPWMQSWGSLLQQFQSLRSWDMWVHPLGSKDF